MIYRFLLRREEFHGNHDQSTHGNWARGGGVKSSDEVGDGSVSSAFRSIGESVPLPSREELERFDPYPETPEIESTLLPHLNADGTLTPERKQIHDGLVRASMTGKDGQPKPSQPEGKRKALMMGGGAASGKTSALDAGYAETPPDAVTVNPDEFKLILPETNGPASDGRQGNGLADKYGDAWASIAHEESSHLGKRLATAALDQNMNIVLDKTSSDGSKAVAEIKRMQAAGYDVDVMYVTTEVDTAVAAALARGEETGRYVPEATLRAGHVGANAAFLDVAVGTNVQSKLVTTTPKNPDGTKNPPTLTAVADGQGGITVYNEDAWQAYVARTPGIPDGLRVRSTRPDEALVAAGGKVRSVEVLREDRVKDLHIAALQGRPPSGMTAYEREVYDDMRADIVKMRKAGYAPDYPINDI